MAVSHEGEFWMYKEGFTPSVWKIVDGLDREKIALLAALGQQPMGYLTHCEWRYGGTKLLTVQMDSRLMFPCSR